MTEKSKVRWGILGPGSIAQDLLAGAAGSTTGVVVALGSRSPENPALSRNFPGIRVAGDYDALIADREVEAIYIATPHSHHARWAIAALEAGKHVLCEKPLGLNLAEARAMIEAASTAGRFFAEAYMYRLHPLTRAIVDLIADGFIGDVRMIRSSFGFSVPEPQRQGRLFAPELGGGGILDVGGYPMSMARLIAGIGAEGGLLEPATISAVAHIGATGVDEWSAAIVSFPNDIVAQLSCSITVWQDNILEIMGTRARLLVDSFWFGGGKAGGTSVVRILRPDGTREDISVECSRNLYSFQFDAANRAIRSGAGCLSWPGMTLADSLGNAEALDRRLAAARP